MTLNDLMDVDAEKISHQDFETKIEYIQNTVTSAIEKFETRVKEIETKNKDNFDTELKLKIKDLLLYGDELEYLLQIAHSLLMEYKNNQGWETSGSADQGLLTVYEELNENETLELEYIVESYHLGITGEELLTNIRGDFDVEDRVTAPDLDVSLGDVIADELSITKIENSEVTVRKKIIWQANAIGVISSGVIITDIREELQNIKDIDFYAVGFDYYSKDSLYSISDLFDSDSDLDDSELEIINEWEEIEIEEDDIEEDDIEVDVDVDVDLEDEELEDVE